MVRYALYVTNRNNQPNEITIIGRKWDKKKQWLREVEYNLLLTCMNIKNV